MLLIVVAVVRQLMQSRYGELLVAVRDGEERVRFLGYDPANIKVVAYTAAALFASIAGALFAPDRRIHHARRRSASCRPSRSSSVSRSAAGPRCSGRCSAPSAWPGRKPLFSERFPSAWTYAQGLLFIVVVGFFPAGLAGLGALFAHRRRRAKDAAPEPEPDPDPEPEPEKVGAPS